MELNDTELLTVRDALDVLNPDSEELCAVRDALLSRVLVEISERGMEGL